MKLDITSRLLLAMNLTAYRLNAALNRRGPQESVRVFVSFSQSRSPFWAGIVPVFRRVFPACGISFYDYTKFFGSLQDTAEGNCATIELELRRADIYVRCADQAITSPIRVIEDEVFRDADDIDYVAYETKSSFEYFPDHRFRLELISPVFPLGLAPNRQSTNTVSFDPTREYIVAFADRVAKTIKRMHAANVACGLVRHRRLATAD